MQLSQLSGLAAKVEAHRAQRLLTEYHGHFSRVREDLKNVPGRLVQAQVRLPQQESARRVMMPQIIGFLAHSVIICRPGTWTTMSFTHDRQHAAHYWKAQVSFLCYRHYSFREL